MAPRTVDGPKWNYGTASQAAAYLGLSARKFHALLAMYPWVRQVKYSKRTIRFSWEDVYCLGHILRATGGPETLLPAGSTRLYSFEVKRSGEVGIGVPDSPDPQTTGAQG